LRGSVPDFLSGFCLGPVTHLAEPNTLSKKSATNCGKRSGEEGRWLILSIGLRRSLCVVTDALDRPCTPPPDYVRESLSTMNPVRRSFAMLLVALFGFSPIGPAVFASDVDLRLPTCCRRAGEHGCAMKPSQPATSAPSAQAGRCRFFPPAKAIPPGRTLSLQGISQAIFAGLVSRPASRPPTEALYRISDSRSRQVRGPPKPLS
jgi:hypothetical protein